MERDVTDEQRSRRPIFNATSRPVAVFPRFRDFIEEKRELSAVYHKGLDADMPAQFHRDARVLVRPGHDEIAVRAYELFLERGSIPGHETADWMQAERELIEQRERKNRAMMEKQSSARPPTECTQFVSPKPQGSQSSMCYG